VRTRGSGGPERKRPARDFWLGLRCATTRYAFGLGVGHPGLPVRGSLSVLLFMEFPPVVVFPAPRRSCNVVGGASCSSSHRWRVIRLIPRASAAAVRGIVLRSNGVTNDSDATCPMARARSWPPGPQQNFSQLLVAGGRLSSQLKNKGVSQCYAFPGPARVGTVPDGGVFFSDQGSHGHGGALLGDDRAASKHWLSWMSTL